VSANSQPAASVESVHRWKHGWWPAIPLLSTGALSFAAFGFIGVRLRQRSLIIAGVVYLIAFVAAIALLDSNNDTVSIVGFIAQVALWIVSSAHAFGIRSSVQERYAVREQPEIVAAKRRLVQRHDFEDLAREQPDVAYEAGIGRDHTRFGGLVDINHADTAEFVSLPGFTPALAAHVVELRQRVDGFDSVLDFASLVDLPAHVLDRLRDRLICLPR
jgi:hypothetical protein